VIRPCILEAFPTHLILETKEKSNYCRWIESSLRKSQLTSNQETFFFIELDVIMMISIFFTFQLDCVNIYLHNFRTRWILVSSKLMKIAKNYDVFIYWPPYLIFEGYQAKMSSKHGSKTQNAIMKFPSLFPPYLTTFDLVNKWIHNQHEKLCWFMLFTNIHKVGLRKWTIKNIGSLPTSHADTGSAHANQVASWSHWSAIFTQTFP
jgi:hypothetical protein